MTTAAIEDVIKCLDDHLWDLDEQDTTDLSEKVRFWLTEGGKAIQKAMEKLQTGIDVFEEEDTA